MKLSKSTKIVLSILFVVVFVIPLAYWAYAETQPGKYDELAQCLTDKGVIFYGAFWCPHCQNQKRMFEGSDKLLPYVECSTPDRRGQTQVCIDEKIQSYPTWVFPDGDRLSKEMTPVELAEKAGCSLPQ